jgi:XTP/dITP diphosphohydrolase
MPVVVLATRNRGKVREIGAVLARDGIVVRGLDEFPLAAEVEEDADTFEGNAAKKAQAAAEATGLPALADDSGLVVDALDGEPGLYSARYGGPGLTDSQRCDHLLANLAGRGLDHSPARFVCVMALARPDGTVVTRRAEWAGVVRGPQRGANGFGYDPLFELPDRAVTAAMLDPVEKNRLSHRGQALALILALLAARPELLAA